MPSDHLILCHLLLLLPSIFPNIRVFSNESALCIRGPKYWSFSFNNSPSNKHPELISFRMDWLDFLAVQGTLKSLLQHHSSKASILRCSAFFIVQLYILYTEEKKKLMSIKLVHIKRVYELLSSQPRDQAHITSISCTGRQIIYWLWHLGIDMHFKNHCHQLLLFMTEVEERTLEEVLISVFI